MTIKTIVRKRCPQELTYRGESISFESEGWWGNPISFTHRFKEGDFGYDYWKMHTTSGGMNEVDVLVQIKELREMLNVGEAHILASRSQVEDKYEIVRCENGVGEWEIYPLHDTFDTREEAEQALQELVLGDAQ
jgi:hypothetical protein